MRPSAMKASQAPAIASKSPLSSAVAETGVAQSEETQADESLSHDQASAAIFSALATASSMAPTI